jgi:hypothetical protein
MVVTQEIAFILRKFILKHLGMASCLQIIFKTGMCVCVSGGSKLGTYISIEVKIFIIKSKKINIKKTR